MSGGPSCAGSQLRDSPMLTGLGSGFLVKQVCSIIQQGQWTDCDKMWQEIQDGEDLCVSIYKQNRNCSYRLQFNCIWKIVSLHEIPLELIRDCQSINELWIKTVPWIFINERAVTEINQNCYQLNKQNVVFKLYTGNIRVFPK